MKSGSLVVKHHSPMYWRAVVAILIIAVVGACWGVYHLGLNNAGYLRGESEQKIATLEKHVGLLANEKITLRDEVALIERSGQVDKQAYRQVKDDLKSLQQEILELREEVSFYRGIVSPSESSTGIRVERFSINEVGENNVFHYKFVLTQVLKNDRTVRGKVKLVFRGRKNDKTVAYNLKDISSAKSKFLNFKFRYFQKFEGDIVLPKGFSAREVLIEVSPKRRKKFSNTFPWVNSSKSEPGLSAKRES